MNEEKSKLGLYLFLIAIVIFILFITVCYSVSQWPKLHQQTAAPVKIEKKSYIAPPRNLEILKKAGRAA